MKKLKLLGITAVLIFSTGCNAISNTLNPFYEEPTPNALLGDRSDAAINGDVSQGQNARQALDALSTYQRAQLPSPNKPVIYPAIVRLVWVPDRLNKFGDLVPAHYYYLKVIQDRPAVTDAFEIEAQLNGPRGSNSSSSGMPYVYKGEEGGR